MRIPKLATMALAGCLTMTGCKILEKRPVIPNKAFYTSLDSAVTSGQKILQENPKLECYGSEEISIAKNQDAWRLRYLLDCIKGTYLETMSKTKIGEAEGSVPGIFRSKRVHEDVFVYKYKKRTLVPIVSAVDTTAGKYETLRRETKLNKDLVGIDVKICAEPTPLF